MPDPAFGRLDEEPIDHGDAEHTAHEHLVDAHGSRNLAIGGGALKRDVLGEVMMIDEVEVGEVSELHLGAPESATHFLQYRFRARGGAINIPTYHVP